MNGSTSLDFTRDKPLTIKCLSRAESGLTRNEYDTLARLSTPIKIQDFIDKFPFNWEKKGDTHMSPRRVLIKKKAHCIEGALLAATALWIHGEPPIIMNLSPKYGKGDFDHVITLFKRNGFFGAISKTNHSCLRFRDPIYKTLRELVLSYFHEWFMFKSREKVLELYSKPFDLRSLGVDWITAEKDLWDIADKLDSLKYYEIVPKKNWKYVRRVDSMELKAGSFIQYPRSNPRT